MKGDLKNDISPESDVIWPCLASHSSVSVVAYSSWTRSIRPSYVNAGSSITPPSRQSSSGGHMISTSTLFSSIITSFGQGTFPFVFSLVSFFSCFFFFVFSWAANCVYCYSVAVFDFFGPTKSVENRYSRRIISMKEWENRPHWANEWIEVKFRQLKVRLKNPKSADHCWVALFKGKGLENETATVPFVHFYFHGFEPNWIVGAFRTLWLQHQLHRR